MSCPLRADNKSPTGRDFGPFIWQYFGEWMKNDFVLIGRRVTGPACPISARTGPPLIIYLGRKEQRNNATAQWMKPLASRALIVNFGLRSVSYFRVHKNSIKVNNINLNILQWIESVDRSPLDIHRMSHELNFIFLYYYLFIYFFYLFIFF